MPPFQRHLLLNYDAILTWLQSCIEMQPTEGECPIDKLEFGGESPLTMRARCSAFRYCPDPLGIVTAKQCVKLEFV